MLKKGNFVNGEAKKKSDIDIHHFSGYTAYLNCFDSDLPCFIRKNDMFSDSSRHLQWPSYLA